MKALVWCNKLLLALISVFLLGTGLGAQEAYLRLASWNIENFSNRSSSEREIEITAEIIQRYDLVAIQEVLDEEVMQRLNAKLGPQWSYIISDPVGNIDKERYAYVYRNYLVNPLGTPHLIQDPNNNLIREPLVASFRAGNFDFTLINIHTLYGGGLQWKLRREPRLMGTLLSYVSSYLNPEYDIILLGDFNLSATDSAWQIQTHTPLLANDEKTTSSERGSYDNIWIDLNATREFVSLYEVFRFEESYPEEYTKISDHRPIAAYFAIDLIDDDEEGMWHSLGGESPIEFYSAAIPEGIAQTGDLRIVEVVAWPTASEAIEITNFDPVPVSLVGWKLGDQANPDSFELPNMFLDSGQSIRFGRNDFSFSINNSGETIYLIDAQGATISVWEDREDSN